MTVAPPSAARSSFQPRPISGLVNFLLSIEPLANFAKSRARQMMIDRAESIGVPWRQEAELLRGCNLDALRGEIENPGLTYPDYYLTSFHAYDEGNLGWLPATEVEVAARAVHAKIWPEAGAEGDRKLRDSFYEIVDRRIGRANVTAAVDLGCGVGMSAFRLQEQFPQAQVTGLDLSSYFLAVASYRDRARRASVAQPIRWLHGAAENTTLADNSCDFASLFLVCHELPAEATCEILREVRRILRPGGHLGIMEMNPQSEIYAKMPPYVFTLLKSTEPYLDSYFQLDLARAIVEAGFEQPTVDCNSPRHRTVIARACG
ncbi:MAG: class I SAM-dependent methyltransferase [Geitlerinemataceae cyanobacterium]